MNLQSLPLLFRMNAGFSILCSIDILLFTDIISTWMGITIPIVLPLLAGGLIAFAMLLIWFSASEERSNKQGVFVCLADASWVLASIVLIAFNPFALTNIGLAIVAVVSLVIATFAVLQWNAIKRLSLV